MLTSRFHAAGRPIGLGRGPAPFKGDFGCVVWRILEEPRRGDDYLEIGLNDARQWNPLDNPSLDP